MIRSGAADLAAFGRPYISNPDLVERFANGYPLAPFSPRNDWINPSIGAAGYTDFPPYEPQGDTSCVAKI